MALARILVHLDTKEGLVESYLLQMGTITRRQILDYDGIPFRCRKYHEVGHMYKDFPRLTGLHQNAPKSLVSTSEKTMESYFPSLAKPLEDSEPL